MELNFALPAALGVQLLHCTFSVGTKTTMSFGKGCENLRHTEEGI